jgi:hypothetical protein
MTNAQCILLSQAIAGKGRQAPGAWRFMCVLTAVLTCSNCARTPAPTERQDGPGGVEQPAAFIASTTSDATRVTAALAQTPRRPTPVLSPDQRVAQVPLDAAAQVASVRDAQAQGRLERLSVNARPTPFDLAAYVRDPASYLNVIEPCRIYQTGDPATAEPLVSPDGRNAVVLTVVPLAGHALQVLTWPGYPATFTSLDRGAFQNGLTSITVQADTDGVATAQFTATAGTMEWVRILAASPQAAGNVTFHIYIPVR